MTKVSMIGAFPPPIHGMAVVNAAVRKCLLAEGANPLVINLAAPNLDRRLRVRLLRLPRILLGLIRLSCARGLRNSVLYMSVSAGLGQVYEVLLICVVRLQGMRVFLHHHSFAYLIAQRRVTTWLIRIAGTKATHIVLSPGMGKRLVSLYPHVQHVISVSNAALLFGDAPPVTLVRQRLGTLGFLSNVSEQKGVFDFLDLCARIQSKGLRIHTKLAGPFQDATVERRVRRRLVALPGVVYVGPQYGEHKNTFLASIDALAFPTHSIGEAEPVTIHEAMSRGIPVIAFGRGCIPEIISPDCGKVIEPSKPFVPAALGQIEKWLSNPQAFQAASATAVARFTALRAESLHRWEDLQSQLLGARLHEARST